MIQMRYDVWNVLVVFGTIETGMEDRSTGDTLVRYEGIIG